MDQPMWNVATLPGALSDEHVLQDSRTGKYDGWWAFLLLFFLFFGPTTAPSSALPPLRSSDVVILLLLVLRWRKSNRYFGGFVFVPRLRAFSLGFLVLTAVLFASTLISTAIGRFPFNPKDFFSPIACIRMVVIAAIMASFSLDKRQMRQLIMGLMLLGLMAAALAFVQRYRAYWVSSIIERYYGLDIEKLDTRGFSEVKRVIGTFGNPNTYSVAMTMLLCFAMAAVFSLRTWGRWMAIITAGSLASALVMTTGSRTGLLAMVVVCGLAGLLSLQGRAKITALIAMVILGFMLMWLRANVDSLPVSDRLKDIVGGRGGTVDEAMVSRYRIWEQRIEESRESILFGVGASKSYDQTADNGYIMVLLRTGLVGVASYVALLVSLGLKGMRGLFASRGPSRALILGGVLVLANHMVFEITADVLFHVKYGAFLAAILGLMCGQSTDAVDRARVLEYGPRVSLPSSSSDEGVHRNLW